MMAGYQKGAQTAQHNLAFTIEQRRASEFEKTNFWYLIMHTWFNIIYLCTYYIGDSPDLIVVTSEVRFLFESPQASEVNISFHTDGIALENDETVSLELVPLRTTNVPIGEGVFFLNMIDMIIIDTDREYEYYDNNGLQL